MRLLHLMHIRVEVFISLSNNSHSIFLLRQCAFPFVLFKAAGYDLR